METKEFIKKKIGEIELWMMDCKAAYPKDINECWRKRMPLLLGLSATVPLLFLAFRCDVWALYWAVPMAWIIVLLVTYMLRSKYKGNVSDIDNVRQSINSLLQFAQYAEIVEYANRKLSEADSILAQKAEYRNIVNNKSITIVLVSNIVLILLILLLCKPYSSESARSSEFREQNPNFSYLGIRNYQEFEVKALVSDIEGSNAKIAGNTCKIAIVDPWSDMSDMQSYAYLTVKGLEVSNLEDDGYYCLKLVDDDARPIPYLPDFVFSKKSLADGNEIISSMQDSENEKIENLVMLRNLTQKNPKFIIKKIY